MKTKKTASKAMDTRLEAYGNINRALSAMRYSDMLRFQKLSPDDTPLAALEKVAENLGKIGGLLVTLSDEASAAEKNLNSYRDIFGGLGALVVEITKHMPKPATDGVSDEDR